MGKSNLQRSEKNISKIFQKMSSESTENTPHTTDASKLLNANLPKFVIPKTGKLMTDITEPDLVMCKPIIMPIKSRAVLNNERNRVLGNQNLKRAATAAAKE